jgi:N-acetylneuraminate synthase
MTRVRKAVSIGNRLVGDGHRVFIVAEIGINHNGDCEIAKRLIDAAKAAGCDAVKFQKRTPELCVPPDQRDVPRETPWGVIPYIEYRNRLELGEAEYESIDRYCREVQIPWFGSFWDEPSLRFLERFNPVCHKVPSALLVRDDLLLAARATGRPLIISTGMSAWNEIRRAVDLLGEEKLVINHSTSTYPCPPAELNLRMIETLRETFGCPIGYSGHEVGLQTTYAAVCLGAGLVERHITLDRTMWGNDHAASVEPGGFTRLVRDIRVIEQALGNGVKQVYESERAAMARLRGARLKTPPPA